MVEKKYIPVEQWGDYIDTFINGHRNKIVNVEVKQEGQTAELLVRDLPLLDLALDPVGKGDAVTLTLGKAEDDYTHFVESPIELIESFNPENGEVVSLEITDKNMNVVSLLF